MAEVKEESTITTRKQKLLTWVKNPYTIVFLAILTIGIILRLKYLMINFGSLWWDEVGWLQAGKIIAGMSPAVFEAAKAPFFPLLAGFIFKLGLGENFIRFFLVFLPSVGVMLGTYILGKEVFNKKVGLTAMSIVAVFSHHLFYAARVMGDMLANGLELLAIALFICFWVNKKKPHLLFVPVILGLFAFMTRYSACISLIVMAAYLIIVERFSLFKNKHVWIAAGVATVILGIFGAINYSIFGHVWPAMVHYITSPISGTAAIEAAHGAFNLSFLYSIFDWTNFGGNLLGGGTTFIKSLLPMFLIGLSGFILMFLGIDKVLKKDKKLSKPDQEAVKKLRPIFALFLWFGISVYFWIFFWGYATPRWSMVIAPAVIVLTAYGYTILYDVIKEIIRKIKPEKKVAAQLIPTIIVITLLIFSLTLVYQRTDNMIKSKAGGYGYLGPVSYWLEDNVLENETVMFPSYIWYEYYTQRDNFITDYDIKYAAFEHRNLTHLFLEEVPYGLIPTCEYDYEVAMRDTGIDYFVWTAGQQVWTPTPEYMNKAMSEGIFTGYANFNSNGMPAAWIFKVNKEALNHKIDNLEYQNQLIVMTTMEQWDPWNKYKADNNITETDICGYVYTPDEEGATYNAH